MLNRFNSGLIAALLSALTGCGTTPPSNFYLLEAAGPSSADGEEAALHIGIRRVRLPEYLRRNAIVVRQHGAEVKLAPLHRWAEPLRDSVPRILAENVSNLLGTDRISAYPWTGGHAPEYEVSVHMIRYDAGDDGTVTLIAHWQVSTGDGAEPVMQKSVIRRSADDRSDGAGFYSRVATAHSEALSELSRRIVDTIRRLDASGAN